jgi:hypothetical protein
VLQIVEEVLNYGLTRFERQTIVHGRDAFGARVLTRAGPHDEGVGRSVLSSPERCSTCTTRRRPLIPP